MAIGVGKSYGTHLLYIKSSEIHIIIRDLASCGGAHMLPPFHILSKGIAQIFKFCLLLPFSALHFSTIERP